MKEKQQDAINQFQRFYQDVFEKKYIFSDIFVPEQPKENENFRRWRLIIVAKDVATPRLLFEKFKRILGEKNCRWLNDCDKKSHNSNWRTDKDYYAIWAKGAITSGYSNNNITFEERLILDLFYLWKHERCLLDPEPKQLPPLHVCRGSRFSDKSIPMVGCISPEPDTFLISCLRSTVPPF